MWNFELLGGNKLFSSCWWLTACPISLVFWMKQREGYLIVDQVSCSVAQSFDMRQEGSFSEIRAFGCWV